MPYCERAFVLSASLHQHTPVLLPLASPLQVVLNTQHHFSVLLPNIAIKAHQLCSRSFLLYLHTGTDDLCPLSPAVELQALCLESLDILFSFLLLPSYRCQTEELLLENSCLGFCTSFPSKHYYREGTVQNFHLTIGMKFCT